MVGRARTETLIGRNQALLRWAEAARAYSALVSGTTVETILRAYRAQLHAERLLLHMPTRFLPAGNAVMPRDGCPAPLPGVAAGYPPGTQVPHQSTPIRPWSDAIR